MTTQLITYLGNKRKLIPHIESVIIDIKKELKQDTISSFDGFSGSGCVSRMLLNHSHTLYSNDLESYCFVLQSCFLQNKDTLDMTLLQEYIDTINKCENKVEGILTTYYAPKDDTDIQEGERVFYTRENAIRIDTMRKNIDIIPEPYKTCCLAMLLIKASIHTNTSGVFKGFHKKDGKGHFGGKGENALSRITRTIFLEVPSLEQHKCKVYIEQKDIVELVNEIPEHDVVYLDPPYNQHPYGSNYFMLNVICTNALLKEPVGVSGIVQDWNKSPFNYKKSAKQSFEEIIRKVKAKYIIVSYNNEGIITEDEIKGICERHGIEWNRKDINYPTYKGSRNLAGRSKEVCEWIWVLKKQQ